MTLAAAIRDLSAHYERVTVVCTSGNHGRLPDAKRMQQKDPTRNWDTLVYLFAESNLFNLDNVRFLIPDSYVASFSIGSKRFVQYHGHGIKSWNSIPHYGIGRWTPLHALMRLSHESAGQLLPAVSHFHSGIGNAFRGRQDFHKWVSHRRHGILRQRNRACDAPSQKMMFVSDPVGVNSEWSLYGEVEGEERKGSSLSYPVYPWERAE